MNRPLFAFAVVVVAVVLALVFINQDGFPSGDGEPQPAHALSFDDARDLDVASVDAGNEATRGVGLDAAKISLRTDADAMLSSGFVDRLQDIEIAVRSDPNAFGELSSFRSTCRYWLQSQLSGEESPRAKQVEWKLLEAICSESAVERFEAALASATSETLEEVTLQSWHHGARTAEEFAVRDARLQDQMQRSRSAAGAFNAAIVFFDYERFSQWAGAQRPHEIHDERSFLRSRIGLDVAWMYACRLGFDCGPYSGMTLLECWETPGCVPGGAARQVVQMRRSPLELRLVDSMVDRLMAERAAARP